MPLVQVVIVLIVVGVLLWLVLQLYPYGRLHQEHPECRCRHYCSFVAPKCIWTAQFPIRYPSREVTRYCILRVAGGTLVRG